MADESRNSDKNYHIFGEFLSNLKVVNFYINLVEQLNGYRVSKLQFERQKMKIALKSKTDDEGESIEFNLPPKVKLIPQTISAIKPTINGWIFRISFEEDTIFSSRSLERILHPKCSKCGNLLLSKRAEFSDGLMVVQELNASSYFCHDHGHDQEDHQSTSDVLIPLTALNDGLQYLIHSSAIDQDAITVCPTQTVSCVRCHLQLGTGFHDGFLLKKPAIKNTYLNDIISQSLGKKILLKSKTEMKSVILWPMDITLMISSSCGKVESGRKVLYKICKKEELMKDCLEMESIMDVVEQLIESSCRLPQIWRFVGEFSVAFIPKSS